MFLICGWLNLQVQNLQIWRASHNRSKGQMLLKHSGEASKPVQELRGFLVRMKYNLRSKA